MDFSQHFWNNDLWDLRSGKRLKVLDQHQCFVVGLPSTMKVTCCEANIYCILSLWVHGRTSHPLTPDIWTFWTCDILLVFVQDLLAHLITTRPSIFSNSLYLVVWVDCHVPWLLWHVPNVSPPGRRGRLSRGLWYLSWPPSPQKRTNGQNDKNEGENGKNIGETQKFLLTYRKFYRTLWWWHFTDFLLNSLLPCL